MVELLRSCPLDEREEWNHALWESANVLIVCSSVWQLFQSSSLSVNRQWMPVMASVGSVMVLLVLCRCGGS